MAFHRLKDHDWLDDATLAFVAALSVGLYLVWSLDPTTPKAQGSEGEN
jgi:hypothetical protein